MNNELVVPEDPTVVESPIVPVQSVPEAPKKKKVILGIFFFFVLALALSVGVFGFLKSQKSIPQDLNDIPKSDNSVSELSDKLFVDCDDIREVLEEGNILYVGCLGGVIIYDTSVSKVVKQISGPQGLTNATVNSLEKKGDTLYIGTQDGFFEYQLASEQIKHISVKEGLVNGSNIELALDGDILWVGTFDGISKYNTVDKSITNYQKELMSGATKWSVSDLLVTPNGVYATVLANAYSSGGIARYDKQTNTWKSYTVADFGDTSQYARADLAGLTGFDGRIYTNEDITFWYFDDDNPTGWVKDNLLVNSLKAIDPQGFANVIGASNQYLFLSLGDKVYKYVKDGAVEELASGDGFSTSRVINLDSETGKIWAKGVDTWLSWNSTNSEEAGSVVLNRPTAISNVLTLIDQKPVVVSASKIYIFDPDVDTFTELMDISNYDAYFGSIFFQPIPNTKDVVIYFQSCGQGCSAPKLFIYDFSNKAVKEVTIDDEIVRAIKFDVFGSESYNSLTLKEFDIDKKTFKFIFKDSTLVADYDYISDKWVISTSEDNVSSDGVLRDAKVCSRSYSFATNNNLFSDEGCSGSVQNENYRWFIREKSIVQVDKATQLEEILEPPHSEVPYSPFADWVTEYQPVELQYAGGSLYVSSNLGLARYNTEAKSWGLIDTAKGLPANDVSDFIAGKNYIWVKSNWGGLAGITSSGL